MTILGKILAIVNLVLSLAVAAFIVMTFVARTSWHAAYVDMDKELKRSIQNTQTYQEAVTKKQEDVDKAVAAEVKAKKDQIEAEKRLQDQVQTLTTSLTEERRKVTARDESLGLAQVELQNRQSEVAGLKNILAERDKKLQATELFVENTTNRAVAAEIAKAQQEEINNRLLTQLQQLTKENQRLQQSGGTTLVASAAARKNPPADDIEGVVKKTDADSGYLTLSIGSDAGLTKGNTLEVYRLKPTPAYLGTLEVLAVRPDEAVAKPTSRLRGTVQVGDRVSSSITVRR